MSNFNHSNSIFVVNSSFSSTYEETHYYNTNGDQDSIRQFQKLFGRILWWYVLIAACLGILLNLYCVFILLKIRDRHTYFTMLTIAVADVWDLFLILLPHLGVLVISKQTLFTTAFCKIHTFLLHSFSAYSIWCWVLLSIIRYVAVFHPYKHLRFQACSVKYGLLVTLILCMITEGWVPVIVTAETGYCSLDMTLISLSGWQWVNLFEVFVTYLLPFICIALTNAAVFGRIYVCNATPELQRLRSDSLVVSNIHIGQSAAILSASKEKQLRQKRFNSFTRLIIIVTVSLTLNLPNCVVRLLNTYDPMGAWLPEPYNDALQRISYALSYTHYAINCIYLRMALSAGAGRNRRPSRRFSDDMNSTRHCSAERRPSRCSITNQNYWIKAPLILVTCDEDF